MKYLLPFYLFCFIYLFPSSLFSQETGTIQGKITNLTDRPFTKIDKIVFAKYPIERVPAFYAMDIENNGTYSHELPVGKYVFAYFHDELDSNVVELSRHKIVTLDYVAYDWNKLISKSYSFMSKPDFEKLSEINPSISLEGTWSLDTFQEIGDKYKEWKSSPKFRADVKDVTLKFEPFINLDGRMGLVEITDDCRTIKGNSYKYINNNTFLIEMDRSVWSDSPYCLIFKSPSRIISNEITQGSKKIRPWKVSGNKIILSQPTSFLSLSKR